MTDPRLKAHPPSGYRGGPRRTGSRRQESGESFANKILGGTYCFEKLLWKGPTQREGTGKPETVIYTGRKESEPGNTESLVIKVMTREARYQADFIDEVKTMWKVEHPNLIKLYGAFVSPKYFFIVMERGQMTLHDHIYSAAFKKLDNAERERCARRYFQQLVDGLDYMQKAGLYHRDLKLENALYWEDGTVKLCDFGLTSTEQISPENVGTLGWMAPEVYSVETGYDAAAADVWSLGIMLFHMLTGFQPFMTLDGVGEEMRQFKLAWEILSVNIDWSQKEFDVISYQAKDLLKRMTRPDPRERYTLDQVKRHRWFKVDYKPADLTKAQIKDADFAKEGFIKEVSDSETGGVTGVWRYTKPLQVAIGFRRKDQAP